MVFGEKNIMRLTLSLFAGALILAAAPAHADRTPAESPIAKGEAKLAQALEGRVAGKPVDCLYLPNIRSSRIIDRTAIVYETTGGTLYVNRPESGRQSLRRDDVMVTDTHSSQLCNIDIVRLFDTGSRMQTGFVALGDFVPYRKVARD